MFDSVSEEYAERNQTVCQIRARAEEDDTLNLGPAFEVEFGDGFALVAYASELRPWYQTD